MARLVVPAYRACGRFAAEKAVELPPDGYKDRLVKYLPAESMAFYTFVDKLLLAFYGLNGEVNTEAHTPDLLLGILPWFFIIVGIIGTPAYLYKQKLTDQPWKLHAFISTLAFVLWAYTLGGSVFVVNGWYHALVAGVAAPTFTFVAGLFEPTPNES